MWVWVFACVPPLARPQPPPPPPPRPKNNTQAGWDVLLFCLCGAVGQLFIFATIKRFGSLINTLITTTRKFFNILLSGAARLTPARRSTLWVLPPARAADAASAPSRAPPPPPTPRQWCGTPTPYSPSSGWPWRSCLAASLSAASTRADASEGTHTDVSMWFARPLLLLACTPPSPPRPPSAVLAHVLPPPAERSNPHYCRIGVYLQNPRPAGGAGEGARALSARGGRA